ncbi:hypothetical protein [Qipengyuania polymorpha]|nr:hypothetical protein [Qipengyuania polymorpha]
MISKTVSIFTALFVTMSIFSGTVSVMTYSASDNAGQFSQS